MKELQRAIAGVVVPFYSPNDHPHVRDDQPNTLKPHAETNRWRRRDSSVGRAWPTSTKRYAAWVLALGAFDGGWFHRCVAVKRGKGTPKVIGLTRTERARQPRRGLRGSVAMATKQLTGRVTYQRQTSTSVRVRETGQQVRMSVGVQRAR